MQSICLNLSVLRYSSENTADAHSIAFGVQICKEFMAIKSISFAIFVISKLGSISFASQYSDPFSSQILVTAYWLPLLIMTILGLTQGRNILSQSILEVQFSSRDTAQANMYANGIMGEVGVKDGTDYDQNQQQQIQLQQFQLQQLQQQQAMLQQQQYMMQQKPQV